MPKALTVGSSTGTNTSSITAPSSTVPKIKNITFTNSMKTMADRFKLAMVVASCTATCSEVMA